MKLIFSQLPLPIKEAIRTRCDELGQNYGLCLKMNATSARDWNARFNALLFTLELTMKETNQLIREFNEGKKLHWNPSAGLGQDISVNPVKS